jgi:hypothetical protein
VQPSSDRCAATDDRHTIVGELETYPPEIGPTGVDLINPDHHNKTHVPLATK